MIYSPHEKHFKNTNAFPSHRPNNFHHNRLQQQKQ